MIARLLARWCGSAALLLVPFLASAQTLPLPVTDDLWDINQGTIVTSHSLLKNTDFVGRNMFGDTVSPASGETGNVLFKDGLPVDTVHWIEWKTAQAITLEQFRIFAYHNTSRPLNCSCPFPDARVHGFRTFRLFAKNAANEFVLVHSFDPPISNANPVNDNHYVNTIDGAMPLSSRPFLHEATIDPTYAQEWRAEFVQYGDPSDLTYHALWRPQTGPRVVELDGFGTLEPPEPDPTPTPEPTPTPTPEPEPIVLVPGLLASYNKKLMLEDQPSDNWDFPFGGNIYRGLIHKFEQKGFLREEKLFIAHYDWRQSNIESAQEYLKPMINHAKQATGAHKVDIVAHSMGGLVARSYIQSSNYENDVDQLIILGTPNEGASDAYIAWEGGEFPERWGLPTRHYIKTIEEAMKENRSRHLPRPLSFREFFPSLRELLPTREFVSKSGTTITLLETNVFLTQLQASVDTLFNRTNLLSIAGTDNNTLNHVSVGDRQSEDIALERWRDGHPNPNPPPTDTLSGDETVLLNSALLGENHVTLPSVTHTALPEVAQQEVLTELGIEDEEPPMFEYEPPEIIVGWVVLSPVDISVIGPGGEVVNKNQNDFGIANAEYDDDPNDPNDPKVITLINPPEGKYDVQLTGTDEGHYTVITTYTNDNDTISTQRSGITNEGKQESFSVVVAADSLAVPPEDIVLLATILKEEIKNLRDTKLIENKAFGKLNGRAGHLQGKAQAYEDSVQHHGAESIEAQRKWIDLKESLDQFTKELRLQVASSQVDIEGEQNLSNYIQQFEDTGL